MMVKVIAVKSHTPDGSKRYKVGAVYEVSERAAKTLLAYGLVKMAPEDAPRREYHRRDMKAES
jgi:hypothetical protein